MNKYVPQLEALEDRQLLASSVTVNGSILTITGDNGNNWALIYDDGTGGPGNLTGYVDGWNLSNWTGNAAITHVYLNMLGGSDYINYVLTNDTFSTMQLRGDLGSSDDYFAAYLVRGSLLGGAFYDFAVDGSYGNDRMGMYANSGSLNVGLGATLNFMLLGSSGNDHLLMNYSGILDGTVNYYANGGSGNDAIGGIFDVQDDPVNLFPGQINARMVDYSGSNFFNFQTRRRDPNDGDLIQALLDSGNQRATIWATANVTLANLNNRSSVYWFWT